MSRPSFGPLVVSAFVGAAVSLGAVAGMGALDDDAGSDPSGGIEQTPLGSSGSGTGSGSASAGALTAAQIYKRDAPGVVFVESHVSSTAATTSPFDPGGQGGQESEATGSGFVLDDDGYILTNEHVVEGSSTVSVRFSDDKSLPARIVGKDESTDLALLKVDPKRVDLHPLALGDSSKAEVGDPTVAIGNPFGLDQTLTTGVVSALQRRITAPNNFSIDNVIQTDAAINPGNSGGPLIDARGRVIGINSQIATSGTSNGSVGIGFAVPINTAKRIVPQLRRSGRVDHAYLGITGVTIDSSLGSLTLQADRGVLVQGVTSGGPAAKAGLKVGSKVAQVGGQRVLTGGDVIVAIDGKDIRTMEEIVSAVDAHRAGDEMTIDVRRANGSKARLKVRLGTRPARG